MIKKRLLCILLTICLLIPMSLPTYAASESNELKNVTLSLYSNLSPERYISGLYRDNTFYITLEDLCALTRGKIVKETEEEAVIGFGNCRNGISIREFVIDVGSGNMAETLYSDKYNITLPSLTQDGKVYVSALHFLRYLGATVKLQEDSPVQFMVIKRYDIFDALSDLINSDLGNFFWWDEVDTGEEDLEDKLTNAGVIALIDRDSNIFRMMFDAKGIEQEALEDALLSIVKNEGQGYFTENSAESELIDTASSIIGAEADWFDLIKEAYADGSDVLGDQISDLASSAAITSGFVNNVIGAFESLKQFDNMSSSQRNLLEKTVLQYHEDSKTLCDGWNVVFDAAKNVSGKIQSEYDAQYKAALDVAESTAYDLLNGATGNPVSIAWSGATLLTKMIPFTNEMIDKKIQLYNSYNCSIIQLIAYEMLIEAYSDWYYGNALYTSSSEQYKKLDAVKQLIILQLKSTLTTREYLINSGFLESNYASEMKAMNQETAILLNKVENCQINGVDLFSVEYENDISWIENYETGKADLAMVYSDIFGLLPSEFVFSSGAGGWATEITLNDDGTFNGQYHDSDMGDSGTGYSNGTVYICDFSGKFTMPKKINEYIYSMNLESLDVEGTSGTVYYEDDIRYIVSDPYGFDNADEFLIYLPGCPLEETSEEFLSWSFINTQIRNTIPAGVYGIYNVGGMEGFMGEDDNSIWRRTYTYSYNSYRSELQPSYYSESHLNFWPESGAATLVLGFDWNDDDQTEFIASDYRGTGEYNISLDFNEDFSSVTVNVKSISGFNLEPWGGTVDGTLSVEYQVKE